MLSKTGIFYYLYKRNKGLVELRIIQKAGLILYTVGRRILFTLGWPSFFKSRLV